MAAKSTRTRLLRFTQRSLRDLFGIGLPRRVLELHFTLPSTGKRRGKPILKRSKIAARLKAQETRPLNLLTEMERYLNRLNRYRISPRKRLALLGICLQKYYPLALKLYTQYRNSGGVPDLGERPCLLDKAIRVAELLGLGHKMIFQHDYELPNYRYAWKRERIRLCAFRILELLSVEQKLRALRYQALTPAAWASLSVVYYVMHSYEDVDQERPAARDELRKIAAALGLPLHRSLQRIFLSIQVFALLDHLSWPTHLLAVVDGYVKRLLPDLTVSEDAGGPLAKATAVIHYNQKRPALCGRRDQIAGPVLTVNLSPLRKQVENDFHDMLKAQKQKNAFFVPEALKAIPPEQRLPLAERLNQDFADGVWETNPAWLRRKAMLRLYSGFEESFLFLRDTCGEHAEAVRLRALTDMLAHRSAAIGEDETATQESPWFILHERDGEWCLQTQETPFSVPLSIGKLVAFDVPERGEKGISFVSRLNRPGTRVINVHIKVLPGAAEAVELRRVNATQESENRRSAAILIKSGSARQVVTPLDFNYREGQAFILRRKTGSGEIKLGANTAWSKGFRLINIDR